MLNNGRAVDDVKTDFYTVYIVVSRKKIDIPDNIKTFDFSDVDTSKLMKRNGKEEKQKTEENKTKKLEEKKELEKTSKELEEKKTEVEKLKKEVEKKSQQELSNKEKLEAKIDELEASFRISNNKIRELEKVLFFCLLFKNFGL